MLLKQAILYPVPSVAFADKSHGPLAACYLSYRDLRVGPTHPRADVLASLRAEIDRTGAEPALISVEHFSSRFREVQIAQLVQDFAPRECQIAVVERPGVE